MEIVLPTSVQLPSARCLSMAISSLSIWWCAYSSRSTEKGWWESPSAQTVLR